MQKIANVTENYIQLNIRYNSYNINLYKFRLKYIKILYPDLPDYERLTNYLITNIEVLSQELLQFMNDIGYDYTEDLQQYVDNTYKEDKKLTINDLYTDYKIITKHGNHCSICFEDECEKEHCETMCCKTSFHSNCIINWLNVKDTCPSCRSELNE